MTKKFNQKLKGGKYKMENNEEGENAKQIEIITAIRNNKPELVKACYAVGLWIWAEFQ